MTSEYEFLRAARRPRIREDPAASIWYTLERSVHVPSSVVKYRIFIASPSGLEGIRQAFHRTLDNYNRREAVPRNVMFEAVSWEAIPSGLGRPQELINAEIRNCDFAVFIFRDRWGSSTGLKSNYSSGCEEEWALCNELFLEGKMQGVQLYFLPVDQARLRDPGAQLKKVLVFRKKVERARQHLCKALYADDEFAAELQTSLAAWMLKHERSGPRVDPTRRRQEISAPTSPSAASDGLSAGLLRHAEGLIEQKPESALPIIEASLMAAPPNDVAAKALFARAYVLRALGRAEEELTVYGELAARFDDATDLSIRETIAKSLVNKGACLNTLGRTEEGVTVIDEMLARFSDASELALRESVATGLLNKGNQLGKLGRDEDAVATYEELEVRFNGSIELPLQKLVGYALFNKGFALDRLGRNGDAVIAYDTLLARLGGASELVLREVFAGGLLAKGQSLDMLGRFEEEIAVYNNLVDRFGDSTELPLRVHVSAALFKKGLTLGKLGRTEDEITSYDGLLERFWNAIESSFSEVLAKALYNKCLKVDVLEGIVLCDQLLERFGTATDLEVREPVAKGLRTKADNLHVLGRSNESIAVYDDLIARFGSATEVPLRLAVANGLLGKGAVLRELGRYEDESAIYDELRAHGECA